MIQYIHKPQPHTWTLSPAPWTLQHSPSHRKNIWRYACSSWIPTLGSVSGSITNPCDIPSTRTLVIVTQYRRIIRVCTVSAPRKNYKVELQFGLTARLIQVFNLSPLHCVHSYSIVTMVLATQAPTDPNWSFDPKRTVEPDPATAPPARDPRSNRTTQPYGFKGLDTTTVSVAKTFFGWIYLLVSEVILPTIWLIHFPDSSKPHKKYSLQSHQEWPG